MARHFGGHRAEHHAYLKKWEFGHYRTVVIDSFARRYFGPDWHPGLLDGSKTFNINIGDVVLTLDERDGISASRELSGREWWHILGDLPRGSYSDQPWRIDEDAERAREAADFRESNITYWAMKCTDEKVLKCPEPDEKKLAASVKIPYDPSHILLSVWAYDHEAAVELARKRYGNHTAERLVGDGVFLENNLVAKTTFKITSRGFEASTPLTLREWWILLGEVDISTQDYKIDEEANRECRKVWALEDAIASDVAAKSME
jgi:hypothetical protein